MQTETKTLGGVSAFTEAWKLLTTKSSEFMPLIILSSGSLILEIVLRMADINGLNLITSILQMVVSYVVYKGFLQVIRGQKVGDLAAMFQQYGEIWKMFLTGFVLGIILFFGFIFLIIPGIYLALKYGFATMFTLDEGLDVGASMSQSAAMTKGRKMQLLGFFGVACVVNIIGAIPAGLGLLVTIPLTMLASAVLYENWKQA